ncbi:MAG: hypothetical protein FWB79_04410 [Treponema sp.]|nr:hypothetical protein [Treponema sp.]
MGQTTGSTRIERLRESVNDKDYMHAAIHRIALVLSDRLMDRSHGGGSQNERQRKRGRA